MKVIVQLPWLKNLLTRLPIGILKKTGFCPASFPCLYMEMWKFRYNETRMKKRVISAGDISENLCLGITQ